MNGVRRIPNKILNYNGEFRSGAVELPSDFVLDKELIPDVRDQGSVNSCVGFSTTNILQIFNQIETGKRERFSAGYVYGKCRDDEDDFEGMVIESTLDYLIKTGACLEEDFPINEEMPDIREKVKNRPDLDEKAEPYHIEGYEVYAYALKEKKYEAVKKALYEFRVPILADTDFPGGSHAVCVIGWDDKKRTFTILNSWGKSWSGDGIGEISYDRLNKGFLMMDAKNKNVIMPFKDVPEDRWSYKAIKHAYNAGFMIGTSEDTFEPTRPVTREELAQALVNLCKKLDSIKE